MPSAKVPTPPRWRPSSGASSALLDVGHGYAFVGPPRSRTRALARVGVGTSAEDIWASGGADGRTVVRGWGRRGRRARTGTVHGFAQTSTSATGEGRHLEQKLPSASSGNGAWHLLQFRAFFITHRPKTPIAKLKQSGWTVTRDLRWLRDASVFSPYAGFSRGRCQPFCFPTARVGKAGVGQSVLKSY